MRREIKFRAWDKKRNKIDYVYKIFYGELTGKLLAIELSDKLLQEANEFELMQYTGLKDSTGKDIYEGDILKININVELRQSEEYQEVYYKNGEFRAHEWSLKELLQYDAKEMCFFVVGNIYEHPEFKT